MVRISAATPRISTVVQDSFLFRINRPQEYLAYHLKQASQFLLKFSGTETQAAELLVKSSRAFQMPLKEVTQETEALGDFYAEEYKGEEGRLSDYGLQIHRSIKFYKAAKLMAGKLYLEVDTPLALELAEPNHPDFIRLNIKLADAYSAACESHISESYAQKAIKIFEQLENKVDCNTYTDDIARMKKKVAHLRWIQGKGPMP